MLFELAWLLALVALWLALTISLWAAFVYLATTTVALLYAWTTK